MNVFVQYKPTKQKRQVFEKELLVCACRQQVCLVLNWRVVRRFLGYSTCETPVQLKVVSSIWVVWNKVRDSKQSYTWREPVLVYFSSSGTRLENHEN